MTGGAPRHRVLFVGAFPPPTSSIFGGNVSDCAALVASSFPRRVELLKLDTTQESVPPPPLSRRAVLAIGRGVRFLRMLHRERPDAVLLFASSGFSFLEKASFTAYARLLGIPSLLSIRSGHFIDQCRRSRAFRLLARALLAAPALLLCQGEQWRRFFEDELRIPAPRCRILDGWVASEALLRIGQERGAPAGPRLRLLFMGWIERFKGVLDLVEALALLRADPAVPPFELVLAGDGGARREAEAAVAERGLGDAVRFAGWVRGADKDALLESSDVFVLPSHTEGLPNAMIEAMAAGLPVVVTPVGSIPDVIEDARNGLLVPPLDPSALARALRKLLVDPALRAQVAAAGHRCAVERFTTERAAERLEALVAEVVEGAGPVPRSATR